MDCYGLLHTYLEVPKYVKVIVRDLGVTITY